MQGANFFTTLDAINGYWQVPVDNNESSNLLTFATIFGRYKCKFTLPAKCVNWKFPNH